MYANVTKGLVAELAHRMRLASSDNKIVGLLLLQHQPHRLQERNHFLERGNRGRHFIMRETQKRV